MFFFRHVHGYRLTVLQPYESQRPVRAEIQHDAEFGRLPGSIDRDVFIPLDPDGELYLLRTAGRSDPSGKSVTGTDGGLLLHLIFVYVIIRIGGGCSLFDGSHSRSALGVKQKRTLRSFFIDSAETDRISGGFCTAQLIAYIQGLVGEFRAFFMQYTEPVHPAGKHFSFRWNGSGIVDLDRLKRLHDSAVEYAGSFSGTVTDLRLPEGPAGGQGQRIICIRLIRILR